MTKTENTLRDKIYYSLLTSFIIILTFNPLTIQYINELVSIKDFNGVLTINGLIILSLCVGLIVFCLMEFDVFSETMKQMIFDFLGIENKSVESDEDETETEKTDDTTIDETNDIPNVIIDDSEIDETFSERSGELNENIYMYESFEL